jgi:hypothetical protein
MMKDTLLQVVEYPTSQSIRFETPIGSIQTGDDSPVLDVLIVCLIFGAFCLWIYVRFFRILKK